MLPVLPEELSAYVSDHSTPESDVLRELAEETRKSTKNPGMQINHVVGLLLRTLVKLTGARRVLELGTFTGYSALTMAEGLPEDGEIITCDNDPEVTKIARKYWDRSPYGSRIILRLGPALETLESVEPPLDLVFIDADKENYVRYWEACLPKVRPGGAIVADNVLWSGRVLDPQEPDDHAIVAFNRHVAGDDRVDKVILPVRDGLLLATKR